jgi:hypothetical protein
MSLLEGLVGPFIGMSGVIIGTLLNEFLRRTRRAEVYSSVIFTKRLEAYETLIQLLQLGSDLVDEAINSDSLSQAQRHALVSEAISPIAQHVDHNVLYINEELGARCIALFMGTEDIHDAPPSEKPHLLREYYQMRKETYRMIGEDSGVAQINKLFHSINRPKITCPVIERIRELRREQRAKK